jgi:hypothetical protein
MGTYQGRTASLFHYVQKVLKYSVLAYIYISSIICLETQVYI